MNYRDPRWLEQKRTSPIGRAIAELFRRKAGQWIPLYEMKPITNDPSTYILAYRAAGWSIVNRCARGRRGQEKVESAYLYTPKEGDEHV